MERRPNNGSPQEAHGDRNYGNEQPLPEGGDGSSSSPIRQPRPWPSTSPASVLPASKGTLSASSLMDASREQSNQSQSAAERSRAARFNAVVDVVYYDSKRSHAVGALEGQSNLDIAASSNEEPRDVEFSGSSDEGDEHVSHVTTRLSSHLGGTEPFLGQRHKGSNEAGSVELHRSTSDLEPRGEPLRGERCGAWPLSSSFTFP